MLPEWWNQETGVWIKIALAAATLAVVIWELRTRPGRLPQADPKGPNRSIQVWSGRLLRTLGVLGVLAYVNFGSFHFGGVFVHRWDILHHYLGAKYIDELGYDGLYECLSVADAEQPGGAAKAARREMTDLRTNGMTTAADAVAHPERCRARFTAPRWEAFETDVAFFRQIFPDADWAQLTTDHGFNASPAWVLFARPLAGDTPATWTRLRLLAALDPALMLGALGTIVWAFGGGPAALVAVVWGTYFPGRLWWTGGSFLRWDWLAALLVGLALSKRGRPFAGGALLGYAALSRIFPAFALVGALLAASTAWLRRRPIDKATARLLTGALAAGLLLAPIASIARPAHGWTAFARNLAKHTSVASANRMGVAVLLAYDPANAYRELEGKSNAEARARWERAQEEQSRARRWLWLTLAAGAVLAVAFAVREQPVWTACLLGLLLVPFGRPVACYYYAFVAALPLLAERRAEVGGITVALALSAGIVSRLSRYRIDEQYAAQSLLVVCAFVFIASCFLDRARIGTRSIESLIGPSGIRRRRGPRAHRHLRSRLAHCHHSRRGRGSPSYRCRRGHSRRRSRLVLCHHPDRSRGGGSPSHRRRRGHSRRRSRLAHCHHSRRGRGSPSYHRRHGHSHLRSRLAHCHHSRV